MSARIQLKKIYFLESAREITTLKGTDHPCGQIHGHSFKVTVCVSGLITSQHDWLIDYTDLDKITKPVLSKYDHQLLNRLIDNPTTEALGYRLYKEIGEALPTDLSLDWIEISETHDTAIRVSGTQELP